MSTITKTWSEDKIRSIIRKLDVHNPEPEHHLHGVLAPSCRRVSPMFIGRKHQ